ncbi:MAG: radical SAM protein [Clostridia bacterium]|nr:radical SAM protein [Clostridia bacterium]
MTDKAYVEITNICNLRCSFCAGHKRKFEYMEPDRFKKVLERLDGRVKYLYLHLMGEPLTHPKLKAILDIADSFDFRVMLTTNGTLLDKCSDILLECKKLFKISISIHAYEGNGFSKSELDDCINRALAFAEKSSARGIITVFRLWNSGGKEFYNSHIISRLHAYSESTGFSPTPNRSGERLKDKLFIEWGERFEWPDPDAAEKLHDDAAKADRFCFALRDQFGILVDGTVVPCCLDHEGMLALGNILTDELDTILQSPRARAIYDGFTRHRAVEKYCQTCERVRPGSRDQHK